MSCKYQARTWCLLLAATGFACAGAKPYQTTFNTPVLQPRETPEVTKDGVTIAAIPITRENMLQFPEAARMISWREPDPGALRPISTGGQVTPSQVQTVVRSGPVALVPLPSFQIRIVNHSRHPVSFARAQFQLQDNLNRRYPPIVDPVALKGRFIADINGQNTYIANDRSLIEPLQNEVQRIPILNSTVTVPPGGTWVGVLPIDTPARDPGEYAAFMNSVQNFILRMEGVGTANSGTTGTEFAFVIDKGTRPIAVTCPGDVKEPSLEKCTSNDPGAQSSGSGVTRPGGPTPR